MFLLILIDGEISRQEFRFTFHNVSINSREGQSVCPE